MENIGFIVLALLVGGAIAYFFTREKKGKSNDDTGMNLILEQINHLSRTMDQKLGESHRQMNENLKFHSTESSKIIRDVTEKLTKLDETNKQVVSFADQLQSLENILKNPKQRGILGEYYLETLLQNVMSPETYQMQYGFNSGEIVDAVVFIKDKIIPIDSKFSLENYNRYIESRDPAEKERFKKVFENDLKLRIKETSKYVRPEEDTLDFAFMFIPSEGIYYELLTNNIGEENLIQRAAREYKVIIVSPTSFLAYLQTVIQGLRKLEVEEKTKDIIKNVDKLTKHLQAYDEYHTKLGNTLSTAINHYNASGKELKKIDKDVLKISGASPELSQIELEKPKLE